MAILDQGLISGSNFLLSILLARWLEPKQYGAYAIAFAVFLLVSQLHQSLLLEPMSIYGGSTQRHTLHDYLSVLLRMHCMFAGATGAVLIAAAAVAGWLAPPGGALAGALLGVSFTAPCVLLLWVSRRALYIEGKPAHAVVGAAVYTTLILVATYAAQRAHRLSPLVAFVIMGAAALVTSLVQLRRFGARWKCERESRISAHWPDHWKYGRWAFPAALAFWVVSNVYYVLLGGVRGMQGAAEIKALLNLGSPFERGLVALSLLFLPYAAGISREHGAAAGRKFSYLVAGLFALAAAAYWAVFLLGGEVLMSRLYQGKYNGITAMIPWVAAASVMQSATAGLVIGLRALRAARSVFIVCGVGAGITLTVGAAGTYRFGLQGVVVAMFLASAAMLTVALVCVARDGRAERARAGAPTGYGVAVDAEGL